MPTRGDREEHDADDEPLAGHAGAVDRDVAHRRQRRHPAGTDGRHDRAHQRDDDADDQRDDERARADHQAASAGAEAGRVEQRRDQRGEADAADEAEHEPPTPTTQRLDEQRPGDLARLAPMARSSAFSCWRWAALMLNTL